MIDPAPIAISSPVAGNGAVLGASSSTLNVRAPQTSGLDESPSVPNSNSSLTVNPLRSPQDTPHSDHTSLFDTASIPSSSHAFVPPPNDHSPLAAPQQNPYQLPTNPSLVSTLSLRGGSAGFVQPFPQAPVQPTSLLQPHADNDQPPHYVPVSAAASQAAMETPHLPLDFIPLPVSIQSTQPVPPYTSSNTRVSQQEHQQHRPYPTPASTTTAVPHYPSFPNVAQPTNPPVKPVKVTAKSRRKWFICVCLLVLIAVAVVVGVVVSNKNKQKENNDYPSKPRTNTPTGQSPRGSSSSSSPPTGSMTLTTSSTLSAATTTTVGRPTQTPSCTGNCAMGWGNCYSRCREEEAYKACYAPCEFLDSGCRAACESTPCFQSCDSELRRCHSCRP